MADVVAKGIDVSYCQGKIDWARVKQSGKADFALIRSGFGWDNDKQIDAQFRANVDGCLQNGIPFGLWHYSYAWSVEDARCEARWFLKVIAGLKPEYPVAWDFEEAFQIGGENNPGFALAKQMDMIDAFMEIIEAAGYYAAFYSTGSAIARLRAAYPARMARYTCWVAHIDVNRPMTPGGLWQYSWTGRADGIGAEVDLDYAYQDYPELMRAHRINGWTTGAPDTPPAEDMTTIPTKTYNALCERSRERDEYKEELDQIRRIVEVAP